ncbi:MAG: hypothetical protein D6751_09610, partial [Deltaproteobacteria bacterium]
QRLSNGKIDMSKGKLPGHSRVVIIGGGIMYGWLPRGKGFSIAAGTISVAAMYTASGFQRGGCAP